MSPGEVFDLAVAYGIHVWPTLMAVGGIALIFLLFTLFIALQGIALVGPPRIYRGGHACPIIQPWKRPTGSRSKPLRETAPLLSFCSRRGAATCRRPILLDYGCRDGRRRVGGGRKKRLFVRWGSARETACVVHVSLGTAASGVQAINPCPLPDIPSHGDRGMAEEHSERTDRQFAVRMADGTRAMIDTFGGEEIDIATSKGVVRFEFSRLFGPMPVTKTGAQPELSSRHPFWRAVSLWKLQGCETENGEAIWREPKKPVLQHIRGRHYRVIEDGEPGHDW